MQSNLPLLSVCKHLPPRPIVLCFILERLGGLEPGRCGSLETKAALQAMQGRIRSTSLLHELLYRSETFAKVDWGDYLKKLAIESFRSLVDSSSRVTLPLDVCAGEYHYGSGDFLRAICE